mgnify:CR=1 FL=1
MQQAISHIKQSLSPLFSEEELDKMVMWILQHITQKSLIDILINKNTILSEKEQKKTQMIVKRLLKEEPLQYILGETEFFSLPFYVDSSTLIPRPETEELVEWILESEAEENLSYLDIGTGSACVIVSLAKKRPFSSFTAIDISEKALEVAKKNAERHLVTVDFIQLDILKKDICLERKFDVIVSNPPYVCESEKKEMKNNVLNYEPHLALFVEDKEPLLFYEAIAEFSRLHLSQGGSLYFEINRRFYKEVSSILKAKGFSKIEKKVDVFGNDRMVKARWDGRR